MASRTKKAALRYIVASLPDEVTAGLYNLFQDFDQVGGGGWGGGWGCKDWYREV